MTNPAGAAIVHAVGPIRQVVVSHHADERRYLVIVKGTAGQHSKPVQVQMRESPLCHCQPDSRRELFFL